MSEPAIRLEALHKIYRVYNRPADRLLEALSFVKGHREFPALEDISAEIASGETVGLIGQNGAGKSTLLKIVAGVAAPTSGTLKVRGTVASILELGTGFHPEFSGRENATLNGAILGLTPSEVRKALPRILEFSELGPFIDRPVRTYSSGMVMRLAFSIAVMVDPDILIIDEALAVGDGHFQKKCVDRIRQFQESGRTLLFCSHALYFVTTLCSRTMWLDQGRLMRLGPSSAVVHEYERFLLEKDRRQHPGLRRHERARGMAKIDSIEVLDAERQRASSVPSGADLTVRIHLRSLEPERPIRLSVAVVRAADELPCCVIEDASNGPLRGSCVYEVEATFRRLQLTKGDYGVVVLAESEEQTELFDRVDVSPAFQIEGDRYEIGMLRVAHDWRVHG